MEVVKPVLVFLVGVVAASAFFISGLGHSIPHWARFWQEEPIRLAIVPSGTQEACPPSYAIDNRTDQPVVLTMTDTSTAYTARNDYDRSWGHDRDYDRPYPRGAAFQTGDITGGSLTNPESSEPSVSAPDDADPGASNYGGSYSDFGSSNAYDRGGYDDNYSGTGENTYGQSGSDSYGRQPSGRYSGGHDSFSSAPSGQPLPLTPPYGPANGNSFSQPGYPNEPGTQPGYGAPPLSAYGPPSVGYGPPAGGYGPPATGYGPPPTIVKPGEIYFASSESDLDRCNGRGGSVTLQFKD